MMKKQKNHTSTGMTEEKTFSYFNKDYKVEVLDRILIDIKKNNDAVILVDGGERTGKSVLTGCSAKYLDDSFNVDRIVFDGEDLLSTAKRLNKQKYKAIQYDEAVTGLLSTDFMKENFKKLIKLFSMSAKRNHIVFLIVPNIKLMPSYLITHRCAGLIHVYKQGGKNRGYAKFYSKEKLEYLHFMLKKKGNSAYKRVLPDGRIRFTKDSVKDFESFIDIDEYDRKKTEAIDKLGDENNNKWKDRMIKLMKYCGTQGITQVAMAKELGVSRSQVNHMIRGVE